MPFKRLKVKLKTEIVTMGADVSTKCRGQTVKPHEWNALIAQSDVCLLDIRNEYEHEIGSFKGAHKANINTFRSFPNYVQTHLKKWRDKNWQCFVLAVFVVKKQAPI